MCGRFFESSATCPDSLIRELSKELTWGEPKQGTVTAETARRRSRTMNVAAGHPLAVFRQWSIHPVGDPGLRSLQRGLDPWPRGDLQASCGLGVIDGHDHPAPHAACSCGYSGYYNAGDVFTTTWITDRHPPPGPGSLVAGAALVWGAVELHHRSLRAERIRPIAVSVGPRTPPWLVAAIDETATHDAIAVVSSEALVEFAFGRGMRVPSGPNLTSESCVPAQLFEHLAGGGPADWEDRLWHVRRLAIRRSIVLPEAAELLMANASGNSPHGDLWTASALLAFAAHSRSLVTLGDAWAAVAALPDFTPEADPPWGRPA